MTTGEVLRKAKGLYALAPSHAAAGDMPRPGTRCIVLALDEAVRADRSGESERAFNEALATFQAASEDSRLVEFNAEHSTEEVLAVFDKAIELAA